MPSLLISRSFSHSTPNSPLACWSPGERVLLAALGLGGCETQAPPLDHLRVRVLCRAYLLLWYRSDFFEAVGLTPPETWDELLAVALNTSIWQPFTSPASTTQPGPPIEIPSHSAIENVTVLTAGNSNSNGPPNRRHILSVNSSTNSAKNTSSSSLGSNRQIRSLCLDLAPNCAGSHVLAAIFASLTAYAGNTQVCAHTHLSKAACVFLQGSMLALHVAVRRARECKQAS